jgi:hypothetical protein
LSPAYLTEIQVLLLKILLIRKSHPLFKLLLAKKHSFTGRFLLFERNAPIYDEYLHLSEKFLISRIDHDYQGFLFYFTLDRKQELL